MAIRELQEEQKQLQAHVFQLTEAIFRIVYRLVDDKDSLQEDRLGAILADIGDRQSKLWDLLNPVNKGDNPPGG